ncbi:MAG: PAS domain S-box protein [Mariniphaga sp.]
MNLLDEVIGENPNILLKRLQYEKLLSTISGRTVGKINLDEFLDFSLAEIGSTLGVSRAYIFEDFYDSGIVSNTYEWCDEGIIPLKDYLQEVPTTGFNIWVDSLKQNRVICYSDIEDIPDKGLKEILLPQNILSILVVPLIVDDQYFGFIGFDDCIDHRKWPEEDIGIIMSLSRIISGTIGRHKAEVALLESEKKYRTLFENMVQGVVYQNSEGKIIHANPSAGRILGLTFEQMKGRDSSNPLWHTIQEDGSEFDQESNPAIAALRTGKECHAIMGVFNPNRNKYFWVKVHSVPEFRGNETKPYQVFTTIEDITLLREALNERNIINRNLEERVEQRTREILQLSKLQQAILNNAGLAIIFTSTDGVIRLFNNAAEQMLGYSSDEVVGKFTPVHFHSPDELLEKAYVLSKKMGSKIEPGFVVFSTLLKESGTSTNEWTYIRKDGSKFPIKLTVSAIEDDHGKVLGYIGIAMDISQEKISNQSLRESEERFHKMFHNHAAVMLLVKPESGKIVDANNAAKVFYGYNFNENKSISVFDLNSLSQEELQTEMDYALSQKRNYFQFKHRLSTGETRTVEVHSTPIEVHGETLLFSIIHDITERWQTEVALKNSEKHLNQITDSIPVFISLTNKNLDYIFVNRAYEEFFNLPKSEILRKNVKELINKDAYDRAYPYLQKALDGQMCSFENQLLNYAGIKKIVQTTYLPYYQDNLIIGILTTVIDITDRVQAENLLRKSEAENRAILSAVPDILFRLDKNGVFLASHTGNPDSLYASPDYFLGKKIEEVLPSEIATLAINALAKTFEIHDTITFEYELSINGELRYFEDRILEISDNEALSIIRDITGRKLAEIGLQTTSKKLSILLQNLSSGTLFEDETRHITLANQSFCDLFKISVLPDQLVGFDCDVVTESGKQLMKDPGAYIDRISKILCDGVIVANDELFLQDGRVFERDYVPIRNNNLLLGHLWNYRDISTRKQLEETLMATVAKEKELNDLKSRFVSVASHEFRTPLATILITNEALAAYWKRMDQEQIDTRLQIIKDQVVHLTNVVTDVMQIAKIQEGKISVDPSELDLLHLCKEIISSFNINFPQSNVIQFVSDFQEMKMLLDNRIMMQVMNNLISNAIKYSVGNPSIVVELFEKENEIVLGVTDHGIGIAEIDQKYLFQPFYRASNVEKIPGNGLGLNIVRESLLLLGGDITFISSLGNGSIFHVHLPENLIVSKKV